MTVAVTGATGFVGQALVSALLCRDRLTRAIVRRGNVNLSHPTLEIVPVNEINGQTEWTDALANVDCIVHCAGSSDATGDTSPKMLAHYRATNTDGTRRLAEKAAECGVRRLVFLSSVKVYGGQPSKGLGLDVSDLADPDHPYGISKWEAEQALIDVAVRCGLEVVIIRLPLVYGPGVKGNFLLMLKWASSGIPMPLGAVDNLRSFVGINNLIDLIIKCTDHSAAANQTFLVSDDEDLSTTDLLLSMRRALNKPARLLPFPTSMLWMASRLLGKKPLAHRILGNLQVDISKTKELLDWAPPSCVNEEIQKR